MYRKLSERMLSQASTRLLGCRRNAAAVINNEDRPRLVDCRQGEKKVFATFTKQEMQQRVDKLRAFMAEQKIEACVFTSYHNVNYFSGFLYCAFGRPYGLVVTDEDFTVIAASEYRVFIKSDEQS